MITARRHLTPETRLAAATQLQDQILACVRREHPSTIAAYVPVGTEPGGSDLPEFLAAHARVLLPILLPDGDLDWVAYEGPSSLIEGPRGLREPTGPRLGVTTIESADLILVPALAVDRRGIRLGRGGGSYDRALARLISDIPGGRRLVVALLHDGELIDHVPAEPHDQPVDAVITPSGGFRLRPATEWTK
ncbi:5-formyltetrahydrofolate cyclo-ligase [Paractinoplanes durhamensis]|uniref:5-formyltetrahydrofolate cyclo-ligase n=1 Tax=Paractinoplanes durhamensis TaxID=113563 RepID=A0ABQ3YPV0_9ACTN|nr:5-formyltetrahydrofolate cyclo-ligase [Actinoplanes durhamensis]